MVERLRYQADLARRQFLRVDPDNRLVAAELEARWEAALREFRQAEESAARPGPSTEAVCALTPELRAAFTELGRKLPAVWGTPLLSNHQRKALLRCLIEKVVIHRVVRDLVQARIESGSRRATGHSPSNRKSKASREGVVYCPPMAPLSRRYHLSLHAITS